MEIPTNRLNGIGLENRRYGYMYIHKASSHGRVDTYQGEIVLRHDHRLVAFCYKISLNATRRRYTLDLFCDLGLDKQLLHATVGYSRGDSADTVISVEGTDASVIRIAMDIVDICHTIIFRCLICLPQPEFSKRDGRWFRLLSGPQTSREILEQTGRTTEELIYKLNIALG